MRFKPEYLFYITILSVFEPSSQTATTADDQQNQPPSPDLISILSNYVFDRQLPDSVVAMINKESSLNTSDILLQTTPTPRSTTTIKSDFTSNKTEISSSLIVLSIGKESSDVL